MTPTINAEFLRKASESPAFFRDSILIDAGGELRPYGQCLDAWQRDDFAAIDPGLIVIAGVNEFTTGTEILRAYLERARGHSKTTDLAVMITWLLAFSPRKLMGVAAAADKDQAKLLRDGVENLVRFNPWLSEAIETQTYKVVGKQNGGTLDIVPADAASSYGITPDFVICDELTHWAKRDLFDSLFSAAAKKSKCLFIIISNAGCGQGSSWQWTVRETVRQDPDWFFHSLDGPKASWISAKQLEEQKKLLPNIAYRRLWLNQWTTSAGDALNEDDIAFAFSEKLGPIMKAEPGFVYGAGLDLGLSRDSAGFVIVGREIQSGRFSLARVKTWKPSRVKRVDLEEVENEIIASHRAFKWSKLLADPWQGEYLMQRLRKVNVPIESFPLPPANYDRLTRHLVNQFSEGNVRLFDCPTLERELRSTSVVECYAGRLKLTHARDEHGHGDTMMGLALALLAAQLGYNPQPTASLPSAYVPKFDSIGRQTGWANVNMDRQFIDGNRMPAPDPTQMIQPSPRNPAASLPTILNR